VLSSGGVKCWGLNGYGQLGNGELNTKAPFGETTPVDVKGLTSGVSAIAAGQGHTCALTSSGGVKCWGYNEHGQLGDGLATTAPPFAKPAPVDVSGLTSGVSAITIGNGQTCALTSSPQGASGGGAKCWGTNGYGELGDGTITNRAAPVDVSGLTSGVSAIAAGYEHTCALMSGGGVKCWGGGRWGNSTSPYNTYSKIPIDVSGLTSGVSAITAGHGYTCVLTSDGGVKCWGLNGFGQLGDGTTTDQPSPVDVKR
jgi:alpha-tubulin suppressor-like RCC1 family protein